MSLRSLLMPTISQHLLSRERLEKRRAKTEAQRQSDGEPHQVHYFHQTDDPYSALTAQVLRRLTQRYDVTITPHVVGPPPNDAAPEREMLKTYSRKDATLLAHQFGLSFCDAARQPSDEATAQATSRLVAAIARGTFVDAAAPISASLWQFELMGTHTAESTATPMAGPEAVNTHLKASNALRQKLGHYLGATFYYGGEWYWGIDRLYHLEQRLMALKAERDGLASDLGGVGMMFAPPSAAQKNDAVSAFKAKAKSSATILDFFFSFRSPYSAIVTPRVFELSERTGIPVRLRYVLPMVMRGLPVPKIKRQYIAQDAAREAYARGIPFGRINDPVGRPTERGLSLMPLAERMGLGQAYVASFMRGVWAEGLDAGSERGLRLIAERAGLDWHDAQSAMQDEAWRAVATANREALFALGLWGVPSFKVGDVAVWGQDRIWAIENALAL